MVMSFNPVQLERFRREAKKLRRELSIPHSEALDRIAAQNGFTKWSLLSKHSSALTTPVIALTAALQGSIRYYLHGDVVEDDPTKCYCARCDVFWPLSHLIPTSYHSDGKDGERFLSNLASWNSPTFRERGRYFRPDGAPNILETSALAEQAVRDAARAAREADRSPFHRWLEEQRDRNDPIGDLAVDILNDEQFPSSALTLREVEEHLAGYGAHIIRAVRRAWQDFTEELRR